MNVDKRGYLALAVAGLLIPYSQFVPYLLENGLNIGMILSDISSSRIAAFGWLDVAVSAVVLVVMILDERDGIRHWWLPVVDTFTVGISCGLPMYMYLRGE